MSGIATAVIGSAIIGGFVAKEAAEDAADAQIQSSEAGIASQEAAAAAAAERAAPFVELGTGAAGDLQNFLADPTQQLGEINPLVSFLRDQGFESIQETAAANKRLGAGGTLKDLTQFNTDLASTIVPQLQNQRFNQLFNTASLGSNAAAGVSTNQLNTASNIGNLLGAQGAAEASGIIGGANAITGGIQNIAGAAGAFPGVFGGSSLPPPTTTTINDSAAVIAPATF
jgi:hypothetical protein